MPGYEETHASPAGVCVTGAACGCVPQVPSLLAPDQSAMENMNVFHVFCVCAASIAWFAVYAILTAAVKYAELDWDEIGFDLNQQLASLSR